MTTYVYEMIDEPCRVKKGAAIYSLKGPPLLAGDVVIAARSSCINGRIMVHLTIKQEPEIKHIIRGKNNKKENLVFIPKKRNKVVKK